MSLKRSLPRNCSALLLTLFALTADAYSQVTLYEHAGGKGKHKVFSSSVSDLEDHTMKKVGLSFASVKVKWHDEASSIRIADGYRVKLYKDTKFQGKEVTLYSGLCNSIPSLHDAISSFRVDRVPKGTPVAKLYLANPPGTNYQAVGPGSYGKSELIDDNSFSAIYVPHGAVAILYDEDALKGPSRVFPEGTYSLSKSDFNDKTSSVEILLQHSGHSFFKGLTGLPEMASSKVRKLAPLFDYDKDSPYATAAVGREDGQGADDPVIHKNPGLDVPPALVDSKPLEEQWKKDMEGAAWKTPFRVIKSLPHYKSLIPVGKVTKKLASTHPLTKLYGLETPVAYDERSIFGLRNANTYARRFVAKHEDGSNLELIMYAQYFPRDVATTVVTNYNHRHDWEYVGVWLKNGEIAHAHYSAHKDEGKMLARKDVAFVGERLKAVYHKDSVRTHCFRFAGKDESDAENATGEWVTPAVLEWEYLEVP